MVNMVRRVKITYPDVSEHLLEVVRSGAECEMVENVLLHVLDVRIHQSDASLIFTPDIYYFITYYFPVVIGYCQEHTFNIAQSL